MPCQTTEMPAPLNRKADSGLLFPLSIFVSSFLLFQVQPIMAKFILPWYGGAPAVWTTCMLFFQVMLLAGYSYAHILSTYVRPRSQAIIHILLLAITLGFLSVAPSTALKPGADQSVVPHILLLLLRTVGLPYFMLSTSGSLLQSWFSLKAPGISPYRLYAVSNVASLLALLSYPLFIEPRWSVFEQTQFWSAAYVGFALLIGLTALGISSCHKEERETQSTSMSLMDKSLCFVLAMSASALLLAITNHICQDIAVIPFLWILPLSLYLLSFILCFESSRWYSRRWYMPLFIVLALFICDPSFTGAQAHILAALGVSLGALFIACMVCHGELAALKPQSGQLTFFYLLLSAGGACGAIFVALLAPAIFPAFFELHVSLFAIALCCALLLWREPGSALRSGNKQAWGILAAAIILLGLALGSNAYRMVSGAVTQTRNFYGVLRLTEEFPADPLEHRFAQYHGRIMHGMQYVAPKLRRRPNAYFAENTGAGLTFRTFSDHGHRNIGIIGLGAGTLAAYGKPGDEMRFYEINPAVIDQTSKHFTYVQDSAAKVSIVLGDARLSMEREEPQNYDIFILDAFSGDSIPMHLLTREAFEMYSRHLKPDAAVALHITNSHLDLRPVLAAAARRAGMHWAVVHTERDDKIGVRKCDWMLLSKNEDFFKNARLQPFLSEYDASYEQEREWSDAYHDLVSILK